DSEKRFMTETADDLSAPLGQKTVRRKRRFRLPFTVMQALAVLLGLFLVAFAGFAIFGDNPFGGEPTAHVAIRQKSQGDEKAVASPGAAEHGAKPTAKQAASGEPKTVTIIDGSSGKRQDVVIGSDAADGKAEPDAQPAMAAGIMKLPPAVTLAFTPYGSDPGKLAERARAQRHEILLQIPMEPFDYPDNDPGPQTLLATLGAEQNLDRLYWHLSRFQGYAGIANFMGARFVATD